ncbi:hypothetical protein Zm00014a_029120 [Zea mays]|uniref:No apical meristem-associated C-terminal domain-containing protein n=1 Tax=Zea mays TaxID=4577 RepID=A0A3L6EBI8_MAIZE|nr:hypothetical protein Zm00014a_029120 [Zea mays]
MVRPRKSWSGLSPAASGPNLTRAAEMNRSVPRLPACFYNSGNLRILSNSNVQDTSPVGTRRPFTPLLVLHPQQAHSVLSTLDLHHRSLNCCTEQPQNCSENEHLVGATSHVIQIDDKPDEIRKETRLIWKSDEDVRVMSAWLKHSIDSLSGNNKKGDKYWEDVVNEYNLTTEKIRWRTKTQAKWFSYNDHSNKRKEMDSSNPIVDEAEDLELPRPIGQKAAKKAAYDATDKVAKKGAKKAAYDAIDKVLEMQQKISNDKIEASKLSLQAAKDEKEARLLEKESKMLETYACLLKQDMSAMHDEI